MERIYHDLNIDSDKEAWLNKKLTLLTSSDCASLFNLSRFCTPYKLWHRKYEKTIETINNKHVFWGNMLEPKIAEGIAHLEGLHIEPFNHFIECPEYRIGSSFDYKIIGTTEDSPYRETFEELGEGILEIKNLNLFQAHRAWTEEEASPYEEIQIQHQMLCSGLKWGIIGGLKGGDEHIALRREADEDIHEAIKKRAVSFWKSIEEGNAPLPDYRTDADFIISRYQDSGGEELNMDSHPVMTELCRQYEEHRLKAKEAETMKDALKAQMYEIIGDSPKAWGEKWSISAKTTNGTRRFNMKWKG